MNEPDADNEARRSQKYPPEFISHVKEEHVRQTEVTAESFMVIAHDMDRQCDELGELLVTLGTLREAVKLASSSGASVELLPQVIPALVQITGAVCVRLRVLTGTQALVATALARMKLKEIKVE